MAHCFLSHKKEDLVTFQTTTSIFVCIQSRSIFVFRQHRSIIVMLLRWKSCCASTGTTLISSTRRTKPRLLNVIRRFSVYLLHSLKINSFSLFIHSLFIHSLFILRIKYYYLINKKVHEWKLIVKNESEE